MKKKQFIITAAIAVFLASCAAGANSLSGTPLPGGEPAGFFLGLWHGMISLVTFFISLFNKDVNIYEVHNSGWPYNLGFIFGVMMAFGGGAKAGGHKWNRDD